MSEALRARWALAAAIVIASAGCTSSAQKLQAWRGKPIGELIASRGPADRIVAYPFGGHLYIWERQGLVSAPPSMARPASSPQMESVVRREIALVNDAGIITATEVESERPRALRPAG